jgi:hypothetical protein
VAKQTKSSVMEIPLLKNNETHVTLARNELNELLRRIEVLEKIIVYSRRAALRDELSQLEDGMRLERTVKRRIR